MQRIVIVGGGFAGFHAARSLRRALPHGADVDIVLVNRTDYFLYLPLLPEVAAGVIDPRRITVSLPKALRGVRLALGDVTSVATDAHQVSYTDPEGGLHVLDYDRLVVTAGSVNKLLPIPGVGEHAHGFRGVAEALYLRDHLIRQIELAASTDDETERDARCTFVVVGAGYTGTEVAAQGPLLTKAILRHQPTLHGQRVRWLLLDLASRVLPELQPYMSKAADRVLRNRGVEVMTGTSVAEATADGVKLSDGQFVPTRTLAWCVGVRPDPLAEQVGSPTERGRLKVDATLVVPGMADVFACGDAAAVPDLTMPGQFCGMTAQHAMRQGALCGRNVAASLGHGEMKEYRHHDLGFVVDLGGWQATANPLHVPLSGLPAKIVTRGYHLAAMPGNRARTAWDWFADAVFGRQTMQLGLIRSAAVPLDTRPPGGG